MSLVTEFANPGPAWRGKPFWSWNGLLREDELIRQIHVMREMGLGGFFMHSRTGLATEYLGEEWFRLTNACADEAERLGMEAWLYDEDRWPSGTAGGMVTADPRYRQRFLSMRTVPAEEFAWSDDLVAAFACRLDGVAFTECERLGPGDRPAAGKTVLTFTVEEMAKSSFFNGYTDVDRLQREATEEFIRLTHEEYRKRCGDRLGRAIRGIFTDEPHRGAVMAGFSLANESKLAMAPWTCPPGPPSSWGAGATLPDAFRERFGYDLVERLPELFLKPEGRSVSPVKWHYMELLQQLFLENWAKPVFEWCEANGMLLTGHVLHEDSLTCQSAVHGSLMRFYEVMHLPGVDVLSEGNRNFWIAKQLQSAARQLGQKWLLSELYGCTGWQMSFESHKAVGDWQALFGINVRCHHLSWYTMAGEAKRDYPASILHQSSWWSDYHHVESYFARLGLMLRQGAPCCDVLVLNPVESVWCQIHIGWAHGLSPQAPEIRALEKAYAELFHWLQGSQIDFDYADEEMLGRLGCVERDADGTPVLRVGEARYRVAVVGGMTTIRGSSLALLEEFLTAGGKVVFAGEAPAYVDAVASAAPAALAGRAVRVPWERAPLAAECRSALRTGVEVLDPGTGEAIPDVFCQLRLDEDGSRVLVALNVNREQGFAGAHVRLQGEGDVTEWRCLTGKRFALPAVSHSGWTEWTADFPPSGEHVYVVAPQRGESEERRAESEKAAGRTAPPAPQSWGESAPPAPQSWGESERAAVPALPACRETRRVVCEGPFEYALDEPNVCVLDLASWRIEGGEWQPSAEILKVDRAVRRAFGLPVRGGDMVQPWFRAKYLPPPEVKGNLALAFEFAVEHLPAGPLFLGIETPECFRLSLNGRPVEAADAGWWVDTAIRKVPLPVEALRSGTNTLVLEAAFHEGIDLEALYLLGEFGVRLEDTRKVLARLPAVLEAGDVTTQGLPFYSGRITYRVSAPLRPAAREAVFLETPSFEGACVKVRAEGMTERLIAWQPYRAEVTEAFCAGRALDVEVVLTRRNTFGPLHQVPLRAGAYGPGNWMTEGAGWSDAYQLYPAGLLEAPLVVSATES